jgi:hypothetical protein
MSALTAKFFTHVESAGFYATLLRDALDLLPDGHGRTLIDVGCGPGALTRLAAARGYHATGLDGPGRSFLTIWACARNGRAVQARLFDSLRPATPRHHPLLAGLAVATTIEKPASEQFFQPIG